MLSCCTLTVPEFSAEACDPAPVKILTKKEKNRYLNSIHEYPQLNEIERHNLYLYLLETAYSFKGKMYYSYMHSKTVQVEFYICIAINAYSKMLFFNNRSKFITDKINIEYLPELIFFKPENITNDREPWFNYDEDPEALEKRIFILECCVILTAPI